MSYVIKICHSCNGENLIFTDEGKGVPTCTFCQKKLKYLKITSIKGFVYVLSNKSMPGLVKIGFSTRPVLERVAELNKATAVPQPFNIEAYFACTDPVTTEKLIHQKLQHCRLKNKEFFTASVLEAINTLQLITNTNPLGVSASSKSTKAFLTLNGVDYSRRDVEENPELRWRFSYLLKQ